MTAPPASQLDPQAVQLGYQIARAVLAWTSPDWDSPEYEAQCVAYWEADARYHAYMLAAHGVTDHDGGCVQWGRHAGHRLVYGRPGWDWMTPPCRCPGCTEPLD